MGNPQKALVRFQKPNSSNTIAYASPPPDLRLIMHRERRRNSSTRLMSETLSDTKERLTRGLCDPAPFFK